MPVLEYTYQTVALEDPESRWELYDGRLRSKPDMNAAHNEVMSQLGYQLIDQLNREEFRVRINASRVRFADPESYLIPDVMAVPTSASLAQRADPGRLEFYDVPLPQIVEIWSPSTGEYDVEKKLLRYQQRRDKEIWRIHPYERSSIRWILQGDGEYVRFEHAGGKVRPVALHGVIIDFAALFD